MKSKIGILLCVVFFTGCATAQQPALVQSPKKTSLAATTTTVSWYQPKPGISWQWQLSGNINTSYNVDLYDVDLVETPQGTIDLLHIRGAKVICYFSAGTFEEYREDAYLFPAEVIGKQLEGWPDEKWLDIVHFSRFASIIQSRLDLAVQKKCDGVEPDNVDGYDNDTGFDLTYADQLIYNRWLAEQCFEYEECDQLLPFITQNKAVLGVEYELGTDEFCKQANELNFSWLQMEYELAGSRVACN